MVDAQSHERTIGVLSSVMVELMETVSPFEVLRTVTDGVDPGQKLKQLGEDLVVLASAIMVLRRIGSDDDVR